MWGGQGAQKKTEFALENARWKSRRITPAQPKAPPAQTRGVGPVPSAKPHGERAGSQDTPETDFSRTSRSQNETPVALALGCFIGDTGEQTSETRRARALTPQAGPGKKRTSRSQNETSVVLAVFHVSLAEKKVNHAASPHRKQVPAKNSAVAHRRFKTNRR